MENKIYLTEKTWRLEVENLTTDDEQNRDIEFNSLLNHLAKLVVGEGLDPTNCDRIFSKLRAVSREPSIVDDVIEWVRTQNSNGNLVTALEFIFRASLHQRYHENFLVTGLVPDHVRMTIESLRLKGILSESICDEIYNLALANDATIWTIDELKQIIFQTCERTSLKMELSLGSNLDIKINESFHS